MASTTTTFTTPVRSCDGDVPVSPVSPVSPATTTTPRKRSRGASITESLMNARPPLGALAATGEAFGSVPSLAELRRNSMSRRGSSLSAGGALGPALFGSPPISEAATAASGRDAADNETRMEQVAGGGSGTGNGEQEAEGKNSAWDTTKEGLRRFWKWFITPLGFFVTVYMLNVIAWGGMLFLLLCNASPAMCKPTCNDINSPRRIWIEIDSQILNALFCVTGLGLIPWRFRDLYYLLSWRLGKNQSSRLRLQEINAAWYRPSPSEPSLENGQENAGTVTGKNAPPTKSWKLDYVIWLYVWNTFFQCCLCGFMWGMNRYTRPSWSTGMFVALACIVAGMAGGQVWWETRRVNKIEGEEKDRSVGSR
ncbi:hypothetical protein FN846DRAFT_784189 [Sphaerosporella brunnea]|uniref:Uncharacterized protein n=1 Tax=Sphaerosporella brunnea TaxID=1250544 RepID=A0A5J5EK83_9PEZI|nr:hypothetical protein FN846DRAFT_784189 [Sphaerosporella brunnea]